MRVYWCDLAPLLTQPERFLGWCVSQGLSLAPYLRLDDAARHLAGAQLRRLAGADGAPPARLSISHSGALVVCARGAGPLGIDTEQVCPSTAPLPLSCLTGQECRWLAGQAQPSRAFLRLWTRKECLLKAEGGGLADLANLPCLVEGGLLRPRAGRLRLRELSILPGYVTSLCARKMGPVALRPLSLDQVFPL
ncbi:MAG TPA: 4'-phosphopantetheinyl transferase superfamily protein [Candidatus Enterenecus merdae]|nr:4'-phosphopantetheinyl transferase superfamily protein [Candidatus Enterenecus merdae]